MTFDEAERKFRDLQARVQRGEPISRADYEAMVAELAVQDDRGVLWEINPRTGKWMYFDGAEWVVGRPPGHDQSTVMPISQAMTPPPGATPPPMPRSQFTAATTPRPTTQPPSGATPPPMPKPQFTPPPQPRPTVTQPPQARPTGAPPPQARPAGTTPAPMPKTQFTPAPQPRPGAMPAEPTASPRMAPAPPESVKEPRLAGGGLQGALRSSPLGGPNREWIPLAIGAVVLLLCAAVLFAGSIFLTGGGPFGPTRTPTRAISRATSTLPPPTPLPTQPPATPTPAPVIAKINVTSANVRAAPSTTAKVVTTMKNGAQITLIGRSADSQWFQINVAGQPQPAWISIQVFQIASGDPQSLPVPGANPTPTKQSAAPPPPAAAQFTPTPTVIGAPTATPSS